LEFDDGKTKSEELSAIGSLEGSNGDSQRNLPDSKKNAKRVT
jgi:hypothetical protein